MCKNREPINMSLLNKLLKFTPENMRGPFQSISRLKEKDNLEKRWFFYESFQFHPLSSHFLTYIRVTRIIFCRWGDLILPYFLHVSTK